MKNNYSGKPTKEQPNKWIVGRGKLPTIRVKAIPFSEEDQGYIDRMLGIGLEKEQEAILDFLGIDDSDHDEETRCDAVCCECPNQCEAYIKAKDEQHTIEEVPYLVPDDIAEMLVYLDNLRESGVTNMYGGAPYLAEEFYDCFHDGTRVKDARNVLAYWMKTFDERHSLGGK